MKRFVKAAFLGTMFCALLQRCAYADLIAYYSFNATNAIADVGSAISAFAFQNPGGVSTSFVGGTAQNVQSGFLAGRALSQDHWLGSTNCFQFTLDATAWQDVIVSYAWERSSTGPANGIFQYSLSGSAGSFVDFATNGVPILFTGAGGVVTQDLSVVTAIDGNSTIAFRIVGIGASQSGGVLHLDNFTVNAVSIPEPSAVVLAGLGSAVALLLWRRRR
jgi:hypothetical protein